MSNIEDDNFGKNYCDLYLNNIIESTKFKSDIYLYSFSDKLNRYISSNNCWVCLSEPLCICKDECECDHEEYIPLKSCIFELASNCNFIINFKLNEALNKMKNKNIQAEYEQCNIKVFYFDEHDNECQLIYIERTSNDDMCFITFTEDNNTLSFDLSENFSTLYSVFNIRFNYMNYKTEDEKKEINKMTM